MRKEILVSVLCMLLFLISASQASGYVNLTVSAAKALIASTPSLVILDVRTADEFYSGHIRHAANIPLAELAGRLGELDPTSQILVYCMLGGRSATACQLLVDNSFLHVYNMLGGLEAWTDAGNPVYIRYASIQTAIDEAHTGDSIFVAQGTYFERLNITKSLTLVGEDPETTVVDGEDAGTVVRIEADSVTITDFTLKKCGCPCGGNSGLTVAAGHRNVEIGRNLVTENMGYGITVNGSSEVKLVSNTITNNNYGLKLISSTEITAADNVISNSTSFGIYVISSNNSLFHGNDFTGNTYGVGLFYAFNDTFYHNNMLSNTEPVYSYDSSTTWDNGCEGNYWSNYNGSDLDSDGVGDTALPWEDVDSYPLINEFWNLGDIDHDLDVDIFDLVKAAGAYDSTSSDPDWNPHCDIAQPYGVISIYDIVVIAGNYGKEHTD